MARKWTRCNKSGEYHKTLESGEQVFLSVRFPVSLRVVAHADPLAAIVKQVHLPTEEVSPLELIDSVADRVAALDILEFKTLILETQSAQAEGLTGDEMDEWFAREYKGDERQNILDVMARILEATPLSRRAEEVVLRDEVPEVLERQGFGACSVGK